MSDLFRKSEERLIFNKWFRSFFGIDGQQKNDDGGLDGKDSPPCKLQARVLSQPVGITSDTLDSAEESDVDQNAKWDTESIKKIASNGAILAVKCCGAVFLVPATVLFECGC